MASLPDLESALAADAALAFAERAKLKPDRFAELASAAVAKNPRVAEACRALLNNSADSIDLCDAPLGAAGGAAVAYLLSANTSCTKLDLSRTGLRATGTVAIAEALKTNSTLTSLGLVANGMGDAGAMALAESLRTNKTLKTLELHDADDGIVDRNMIGEDAMQAIGAWRDRVRWSQPLNLSDYM